jgi:hypothetical protein
MIANVFVIGLVILYFLWALSQPRFLLCVGAILLPAVICFAIMGIFVGSVYFVPALLSLLILAAIGHRVQSEDEDEEFRE